MRSNFALIRPMQITKFLISLMVAMGISLAKNNTSNAAVKIGTSSKIKLIYSAESNVCVPLKNMFFHLHLKHPNAHYVSEVREELFAESSVFRPPHYIDHITNEINQFYHGSQAELAYAIERFTKNGVGDTADDAFFSAKIVPDQPKILFYIREDPIGSHGDFETTLWLMDTTHDNQVHIASPQKSLGDIDLSKAVQTVTFFNPKIKFPKEPEPSDVAKNILDSMKGPLEQEPIIFGDILYIIVSDPFESPSIVYRFNSNKNPEVVCVTGP